MLHQGTDIPSVIAEPDSVEEQLRWLVEEQLHMPLVRYFLRRRITVPAPAMQRLLEVMGDAVLVVAHRYGGDNLACSALGECPGDGVQPAGGTGDPGSPGGRASLDPGGHGRVHELLAESVQREGNGLFSDDPRAVRARPARSAAPPPFLTVADIVEDEEEE